MGYERLRPLDAALVAAQADDAPLQIGALAVFEGAHLLDDDGELELEALRGHVAERLGSLPRFRQRLMPVPLDQGPPVWVDDPDFDIAHHVRASPLPHPTGARELRALVADLLERPLDPRRPLWELWFVRGHFGPQPSDADEVAAILKASHVVADGVGLLSFAGALLDAEPNPPRRGRPRGAETEAREAPAAEPIPEPGRLWIETAAARARHGVGTAARLAGWALRPRRAVGDLAGLARGTASLARPAPPLPITRPVGRNRDFAWLRLPLADIEEVAAAHHATVNDVALSIVAGALEEYLEPRSDHARRHHRPRVLIPVSTRHPDDDDPLGNRFTMFVTQLPGAGMDPEHRLRAVHEAVARSRSADQTRVAPVLVDVVQLVPSALLRLAGPELIRRQPFVNLTVTNIGDIASPLYLMGARMTELYPFITVTGNVALIIGVMSYLDTLGLSVTVDADVVADLDRLMAALAAAAERQMGAPRAAVVARS